MQRLWLAWTKIPASVDSTFTPHGTVPAFVFVCCLSSCPPTPNFCSTMPKAAKTPTKKSKAPAKEKKEKKEKDPNAPKRPLTAYFLFANDKRAGVKAENPTFKVTDVAKAIGELWKEASEADKAKYQKKADEEKKKYEAAVAKYKAKQ